MSSAIQNLNHFGAARPMYMYAGYTVQPAQQQVRTAVHCLVPRFVLDASLFSVSYTHAYYVEVLGHRACISHVALPGQECNPRLILTSESKRVLYSRTECERFLGPQIYADLKKKRQSKCCLTNLPGDTSAIKYKHVQSIGPFIVSACTGQKYRHYYCCSNRRNSAHLSLSHRCQSIS